ncbi:MAG: beta strand repeat-containing protein, partial [Phascolarctobacterium sp.]
EASLDKVNISSTAANKALVEVASKSESSVTSSADALSVSASGSGAQIGFSTSVSKVHSDADTITSIEESSIDAEDILAKADSNNEILDVAIGLSVGVGQYAGVALAGNIASNIIDNDTSINISTSTLKAHDTLAVLANSKEKLENYGGGLSVGVGTSAAGVAIGATVVTNTITGDTDAIIANSDIVALGTGDGITIAEHKSVAAASSAADPDPVDDYAKYELLETSAANAAAKKGLVVNAEAEHVLRDISITGGVAVGSAAGVAVDATVIINSITGSTSAQVNSTNINNTSEALTNADVFVNAYDKADISSHLDTISVGAAGEGVGVGAAGAGDRNTVQRNTVAQIVGKTDGTTVLNGNSVTVDALGYTKIHLSETGLAAGASAVAGAAVTGAVSVNRFAGNTTASVSNVNGTVHELSVNANRLTDIKTYNNAISLSGGIVGASVSVGVTDVEDTSHTNAELSHAVLSADGTANSKVEVKAENNTQLATELSADSLEISLGESWGIAVSNVNMEAQVGAKLDAVTLGSAEQEFGTITVEANNNTYSKFQNVAVAAGSVLGVGVGHGVLNINTGTAAQVLNSSAFANNINVNAYEKRTVDTEMVGVGVGALYIGVNTMHTNIGTNLQDSYTFDDNQSYNTSEFQTMVNGSLERMNSQAEQARTKTGDNSIQQGNTTINTGHASQGGVSNTISNSSLTASGALQAEAKATTNTDIAIYQATVAIVNVGVPANRTTVEDKLNLNIQNATLQGKTVAINSTTDGEIKSLAGQGGVSGGSYVDTTAYVKHLGQNIISIDGSTISVVDAASDAVNPLSIHALNQTQIDNKAFGMNISILKGGRMVLEGEDSTEVAIALGTNEQISDENSFSSSKQVEGSAEQSGITILAENAAVVKDEIILNESIGGIAAGGTVVASKAKGMATVNVSDKNAFTAQAVAIESLTGGTKDAYTTEAINHSVGVAAGAINVDKVRTYNAMQASTTVEAIRVIDKIGETELEPAALTIGATNATTSKAYIHSVNVGLGAASGSNFAQSHASGQAITTVNAGDSGISAKSFNIFAANSDDILAKADGSNAGIMDISPYAGRVENTVASTTTVNLSGVFNAMEDFHAQALRKDIANFKADALSVTAFGGGDARVDSTITANTNLNANGATILSGGDTILAAENTVELNKKDGFSKMVMGQGYAILEVSTSGIGNTINSTAHVNLTDSSITSAGTLQAMAHTEEQLQVNGYAYSVGAFEGAEVKVENNITNDEAIELQNTSLKTSKAYQDITLAAADDLKLFTYSYSESPAGAVGGANAIVNNTLTRNNSIDVLGGSSIYSSQDIN